MPTAVAKKKPAAKRHQNKQSRKSTKAAEAQQRKRLELLKGWTARNQQKWIKSHPTANLGDLLQYLNRVQEELLGFNEDDVLSEIIDELWDAADWLGEWGPIENHVDDGEPATVGYRVEELDDDIRQVEDLIEALGESYSVKLLLKPKRRARAA